MNFYEWLDAQAEKFIVKQPELCLHGHNKAFREIPKSKAELFLWMKMFEYDDHCISNAYDNYVNTHNTLSDSKMFKCKLKCLSVSIASMPLIALLVQ